MLCSTDTAALSAALGAVTRVFGCASQDVQALLLDVVASQHQLLVLGELNNGSMPSSVVKLNGQAYLEGCE